jgi:hypothetical protein
MRKRVHVGALLGLLVVSCGGERDAKCPTPAPPSEARKPIDVVERVREPCPSDAGPPPVSATKPVAPVEAPPPAWPAPPPFGATTLVFRDLYIGALPGPNRRHTWTLHRASSRVVLRLEVEWAKEPFEQVDRASHATDGWVHGARFEYSAASPPKGPLKTTLTKTFGPNDFGPGEDRGTTAPQELTLDCASRPIAVHPAFATLVKGWKNNDDSMEPAVWAPPSTEAISNALVCKLGGGLLLPFTEALTFAAGKKNSREETAGVEWAFINSDMVIQTGGLRWIPTFALRP